MFSKTKNYLKNKHKVTCLYQNKKNTINQMTEEEKLKVKFKIINEIALVGYHNTED